MGIVSSPSVHHVPYSLRHCALSHRVSPSGQSCTTHVVGTEVWHSQLEECLVSDPLSMAITLEGVNDDDAGETSGSDGWQVPSHEQAEPNSHKAAANVQVISS